MDMTIANEIRRQLGGARFEAMTGAHNFASAGRDLQFKIGRFPGCAVRYVKVTLESNDTNDTYRIVVYNRNCKVLDIRELVYADNLRATFESLTGLETYL